MAIWKIHCWWKESLSRKKYETMIMKEKKKNNMRQKKDLKMLKEGQQWILLGEGDAHMVVAQFQKIVKYLGYSVYVKVYIYPSDSHIKGVYIQKYIYTKV